MRSEVGQLFHQHGKVQSPLLRRPKPNTIPVLAVGGEASNGAMTEGLMKLVADDVKGAVVPLAGHWLMEEKPRRDGKDRSRLPHIGDKSRLLKGGTAIPPIAVQL